jgi:hypothetical protein
MDSRIAQGIWCEICDWILRTGTSLEQHNSELVHRTLLDAVARLAPCKFLEFRDAVTSNSRKKSKFGLKQELRKAASQKFDYCVSKIPALPDPLISPNSQVSNDFPSSHASGELPGQHPKPLAVALWEEPKPLAMRDQYAFDAVGDPFGSLVVELPPPEWNTKLSFTKHWGAQESASII